MSRFAAIVFIIATCLGLAAIGSACSGLTQAQSGTAATADPKTSVYSPLANGRAIFQTGRDVDGVQIVAQSHPLFSSCAACHRADGSGGKSFADGATSADLRHKALVIEQKHPYTLALLERAISTGTDNESKALDKVMPHWHLSKRDLHDVAEYVLEKLK